MHDYYETLGSLLRDRLGTDDDPFVRATEERQGKYRAAGNKIERRVPRQFSAAADEQEKQEEPEEPVRVPVPAALAEDFAVLHVLPGMPLSYCKKAWKLLLKKYHPDLMRDDSVLHTAPNQSNLQERTSEEAAAIVRRINQSYKRIEIWFSTGKVRDYSTL
ncbi:MAG: J domain-containing protein [Treponema sp.]|uniref:J domain-containing protein n=1 Tax=Treponema sp. TaxID=166 RepID=UPI003FA27A32